MGIEGLTNKLLYSVFIPMTITYVIGLRTTFQNTTFIIVFVISQTISLVIISEIKYYIHLPHPRKRAAFMISIKRRL